MSTIKVTNVSHPSAASPAIVLDADGNATVAGMGLVHINTTTFSAVSSVSFDNVFTSDYENYKIISVNNNSDLVNVSIRMRASGTDASGANYDHYIFRGSGGGYNSANSTGQTQQQLDPVSGQGRKYGVTEVFSPNVAIATGIMSTATNMATAGIGLIGGQHTLANAYDGFTVFSASGTITGTIRVYGYQNS